MWMERRAVHILFNTKRSADPSGENPGSMAGPSGAMHSAAIAS
ncbi:hypothetical protein PAMC26577_04800 [Caballeronia sordidicola]|uniref:Uncharacterized protein n=1 Tax=Caballeronia sordidicola TaxID=196367 RepID=A0A242N485_CABSO|nr:hypothetical protein PAMC26577_04800 [Caballeronia sordidicola]